MNPEPPVIPIRLPDCCAWVMTHSRTAATEATPAAIFGRAPGPAVPPANRTLRSHSQHRGRAVGGNGRGRPFGGFLSGATAERRRMIESADAVVVGFSVAWSCVYVVVRSRRSVRPGMARNAEYGATRVHATT